MNKTFTGPRDGSPSGLPSTSFTRRHVLLGVGALSTAALWARPVFAQQATPVASPVATNRDWRSEQWVGTWAASPHAPIEGLPEEFPPQRFEFDDQTVRQIVRASVGGDQLRLRLANTFGDEPLLIGAVHIAHRDAEARIDPASDRVVTFSGLPSVTIPPGAPALSDPVDLPIAPLDELAVSLYLPEPTSSDTVHGFAYQTTFVSPEGDFTAEIEMPSDTTMQSWVFLAGVDVLVSEPTGAVVALGDSITDGTGSTPDANRRWPDFLAARLVNADQVPLAVLNEGIGGNRVLHDGFGPSALARFDRDVLAQPVVTHLIVYLGINDIGMPLLSGATEEIVSADQIIAGLRQLVERAHERGIVVFGSPITPFGEAYFYTEEGEATRQAVNDWIRTSGAYDAVIDFDAVVRDPDNPTRMLPAYDSGDHLHINDTGYQVMAESIDLNLFRG